MAFVLFLNMIGRQTLYRPLKTFSWLFHFCFAVGLCVWMMMLISWPNQKDIEINRIGLRFDQFTRANVSLSCRQNCYYNFKPKTNWCSNESFDFTRWATIVTFSELCSNWIFNSINFQIFFLNPTKFCFP